MNTQLLSRLAAIAIALSAACGTQARTPASVSDPSRALALGDLAWAKGAYNEAFDWYTRANSLDPCTAATPLAMMYENGIACTQSKARAADIWRALYWNTKNRGEQISTLRHLTRLHQSPNTEAEFSDPAIKRQASRLAGDIAALKAKELAPAIGKLDRRDSRPLYYAYLCRAAQTDNVDALCALTDIFTRTRPADYGPGLSLHYLYPDSLPGQKQIFADVLKRLNRAADRGNIKALCKLGDMYKWGIHYNKDLAQALDFYMRAADRGSADAMLEAGFLEDEFFHFPQANRLLLRAVDMGAVDPRAFYCLGNMFLQGNGCTQDRDEAIRWYTLAVQSAPADNQFAKNSARQLGELENSK